MSIPDDTIAYCHACGAAMDVSKVAPFSNVECPSCQKHTRVKREFGPYTLLRRHAIGGMSMVFVGHDNTLDREVALKILSEDYSADEKRISAFEEEARITAAISHPHVVRVFKTGKAFGRFYIAMEMVTGGHLEHQIRERGAIPEAEALKLAIEVAEGLRAAHHAGLIHRDIKPGNILLDSAGSAKIVDFGLALMTKGGVATPDELWATPYYVPPETIDGLEEDYRADVYAFGATFYHALAGQPPCTEESMVTTQLREAKKHVVPLSAACADLTLETCAVIECAMAYEPSARFASYDQLISALQTALVVTNQRDKDLRNGIAPAPRPPVATPITPAERRRRNQKNLLLKIIASAALLMITLSATWFFMRKQVAVENAAPVVDSSPTNEPPVIDERAGLEILNLYRKAREELTAQQYEAAQQHFVLLFQNEKIQEPTRTWCAFEAMLASQLSGNSALALDDAKRLAEHLTKDSAPPQMRTRLHPWLEKMQDLPPIHVATKSNKPDRDVIYLMATMASALKNWQQGCLKQAIPLFQQVVDAKISDDMAILGIYRTKAQIYLKEAALLDSLMPNPLPDSAEICRTKIKELDAAIASLQSRGRAKFNIRVWQVQLERHARRLETKAPETNQEKVLTFEETLRDILALCQNYRFLESAELIKKTQSKEAKEEAQRLAYLGLCESAGIFLVDLESDTNKAPIDMKIETKDGRKFQRVIGAGENMVTLTSGESEASLPWTQLQPTDVIEIYREAVKRNSDASKLQLRHAQAICFQWLSGEKDAALSAASKLSDASPAFKKQWNSWMKAIPNN
jgi:serine/threonine protein kinase